MAKKKIKPRKLKKKQSRKQQTKKAGFWTDSKNVYAVIGLLAITFIVFFPSLNADFVYWDDDRNILENQLVNTFSSQNFIDNTIGIFTSTVIGNYNPLTIWTFGLENMLFGIDQPFYWHLNNVLLHAIGVFLVYRIGILLGLNWLGASLLALLFSIHPMRVESVTWITERKDVLYGALFLGATYQYTLYKNENKRKHLIWMTLFFILSLFAKIQAVTFPIVMMLIDYYMDKKVSLKTITNKWPYLLMSFTVGVIGILVLRDQGSLNANEVFPLWQRLFIGSYSFVVYLYKLVFPYPLIPLYPYPNQIPAYFYPSILIVPIYLYAIYYFWKIQKKAVVFGLIFFLVNIVLLLQVLGAGQGFLADRFTYIAYIGLFFIIAYYVQKMHDLPKYKMLSKGVIIFVLLVFGGITWSQQGVWQNSESLWSHVITYYKNSTLPYGNRANYRRDIGNYQAALTDYSKSLSLQPDQPSALNSRAKLFFTMAKTQDTLQLALQDYTRAVELDPDNGEYLINKGATLARLGRINEALETITKGLELKPDHLSGYTNRSVLHNQLGNYDLALADIQTYLTMNPYNADFWYESGNLKALLNRPQEGLQDINKALSINNKAIFHYRKSEILLSLGRMDEARSAFQLSESMGFNRYNPEVRRRIMGNQ